MSTGKTYLIQMGTHLALSKAEFARYFKDHDYSFNMYSSQGNFVLLQIKSQESTRSLLSQLGGVIRIIDPLAQVNLNEDIIECGKQALSEAIDLLEAETTKKIGLSVFMFGKSSRKMHNVAENDIIKPWIKKSKNKARLIRPSSKKSWNITPSKVWRRNLVPKGKELVLCNLGRTVVCGYTESIFNLSSQIKRDTHRPYFLIPHSSSVRLARVLVNLGGVRRGKKMLDPFCGAGTILQEGLLLGADVHGLDINTVHLKGCKKNLVSLEQEYSFPGKWLIEEGNAEALKNSIPVNSVDCIVTEPYMGPLLKRPPSLEEGTQILNNLKPMYRHFLRGANAVLKSGGRVIVVTPRFTDNRSKKTLMVNIPSLLKSTSLALMSPVKDNFDLSQPYNYKRDNNIIGRDIWVLAKRFTLN